MAQQYDALLWIDNTTALRPIDMTAEWKAGEQDPKTHS